MEKLAEFIKNNPKAHFVIDNDCWWGYSSPEAMERGEEYEVSDRTHGSRYTGYGTGHVYGGDILQALAEIVGVTTESA